MNINERISKRLNFTFVDVDEIEKEICGPCNHVAGCQDGYKGRDGEDKGGDVQRPDAIPYKSNDRFPVRIVVLPIRLHFRRRRIAIRWTVQHLAIHRGTRPLRLHLPLAHLSLVIIVIISIIIIAVVIVGSVAVVAIVAAF